MQDQDTRRLMLGQYELREVLGEGAVGVVYRAFQHNLKREVAIKILPSRLAAAPGYLERFAREAETAASLEHAHIVSVYDYGTQQNVTYIVMRLLAGGTLSQRMLQHQSNGFEYLSLGEIATILQQLASALDYAHSRGVIHRDIKPGNVMFDNHGSVYLTDFGIARLMQATTQITTTGATPGTPLYMSPEQWKGEPLTPASDQYSLAVMIYQLATGHTPFEAELPYALMTKHVTEPPTRVQIYRPDAPQAVEDVLGCALAKNPEDRFPTVSAFAEAFSKAVEGVKDESTHFMLFKFSPRRFSEAMSFGPSNLPLPPGASRRLFRRPAVWLAIIALLSLGIVWAMFVAREGGASGEMRVVSSGDMTITAIVIELTGRAEAARIAFVPSETDAAALVSATETPSQTLSQTPSETPSQTPTFTPTSTQTATNTETATITPEYTLTAAMTSSAAAQIVTQVVAAAQSATAGAVPTQTLTPVPVRALVRSSTGANIRTGPGQAFPIIEIAHQGTMFEVLARVGDGVQRWYLIQRTQLQSAWVWSGAVLVQPSDASVQLAVTVPRTVAPAFPQYVTVTPTRPATLPPAYGVPPTYGMPPTYSYGTTPTFVLPPTYGVLISPTPTPTLRPTTAVPPSPTRVLPTPTRVQPTPTRIRPTRTPLPPTPTHVPTTQIPPTNTPTATDVPPTPTATATLFIPTATDVPPTPTDIPPTATDVPPTPTLFIPTPTNEPPTPIPPTPEPPTPEPPTPEPPTAVDTPDSPIPTFVVLPSQANPP